MGYHRTIIAAGIGGILASTLLTGCFTGVESTPRITYKEVQGNNAEASSPEEALAASFLPETFGQWQPGKKFFVTSPRISLLLTAEPPSTPMPGEGDTLVYAGKRVITDLTGKSVVELLFTGKSQEATFTYRTNASESDLSERKQVEVPFTIDLELLSLVRNAIVGKELYIKTPIWFDREGKASTNGRKFVRIKVADVLPANEVHPYLVIFTDDNATENAVFMSSSAATRMATRDFPSLFSMTDPRLNYPQISDNVWNDIVNSRLSKGMTKTEATLALGTPRNIDRGYNHTATYERWTYPDGIFLIFEGGLLVRFNK